MRPSLLALLLVACGAPRGPAVKETVIPPTRESESSVTTVNEDAGGADPFEPTSGPGDVPSQFIRDERSSRLDRALPHGTAHEAWHVPLGGARREPCRRQCVLGMASFVIAAGNRVAVAGAGAWALFDTKGHRVDSGPSDGPMRIDRAIGAVVPDESRSPDLPPDAKVGMSHGLQVMVKDGGIFVGERAVEGKFVATDVALDDTASLACVLLHQGQDLALWSIPFNAGGSIGRHKLGTMRRSLGPPILGKSIRIVELDTSVVAIALDGKRLWERRGVPSGGITVTSEDEVLIADDDKVLLIDRKGKATDLYVTHDVVFVTPPILNASGLLLVASGALLHAVSIS